MGIVLVLSEAVLSEAVLSATVLVLDCGGESRKRLPINAPFCGALRSSLLRRFEYEYEYRLAPEYEYDATSCQNVRNHGDRAMDHPSPKISPRSPVHFVVLAVVRRVPTRPIRIPLISHQHTTEISTAQPFCERWSERSCWYDRTRDVQVRYQPRNVERMDRPVHLRAHRSCSCSAKRCSYSCSIVRAGKKQKRMAECIRVTGQCVGHGRRRDSITSTSTVAPQLSTSKICFHARTFAICGSERKGDHHPTDFRGLRVHRCR